MPVKKKKDHLTKEFIYPNKGIMAITGKDQAHHFRTNKTNSKFKKKTHKHSLKYSKDYRTLWKKERPDNQKFNLVSRYRGKRKKRRNQRNIVGIDNQNLQVLLNETPEQRELARIQRITTIIAMTRPQPNPQPEPQPAEPEQPPAE